MANLPQISPHTRACRGCEVLGDYGLPLMRWHQFPAVQHLPKRLSPVVLFPLGFPSPPSIAPSLPPSFPPGVEFWMLLTPGTGTKVVLSNRGNSGTQPPRFWENSNNHEVSHPYSNPPTHPAELT